MTYTTGNGLARALKDRNRALAVQKKELAQKQADENPWADCSEALRALGNVDPETDQWWVNEYPELLFRAAAAYRDFTCTPKMIRDEELERGLLLIGKALFEEALAGATIPELAECCTQAIASTERDLDTDGLGGLLLFPGFLREELSRQRKGLPVKTRRQNPS